MSGQAAPDRRDLLREALGAIDELQARLDATEGAAAAPIAVVGMSCRFPGGATSPQSYWDLLRSGRDAVSRFPEDRRALLEATGMDFGLIGEPTWQGGFLDEIDQFDAGFFGISPREAATMDPQQRMVLETSWEALERAAINPLSLKGTSTGVFVGITASDYVQLGKLGGPDRLDVYSATGGALNAAPGRVAYTLGLQGPSLAIDTACSSSLVALHQACVSLRTGETDLGLAGGVNLLLLPEAFVCFERWGMMADDGRCKTFDAAADGFVRGEGCGMLVLKRLSDAEVDGDPIMAVIRGSAVNQDGASSGLTVPNGPAQQAVLRTALTAAQVAPADIQYFEAHGTGTSLGDPIEVEAIGAVLGSGRGQDDELVLGSVKTNIGHLESAAGVAGVIKVILSMQHGEIPPHLHLNERSDRIPWPNFPVRVPTEVTAWPAVDGRRLAGVSGFGFSGTNAHLVIESPPEPSSTSDGGGRLDTDPPARILTLAAGSRTALADLARSIAAVDDDAFRDVAGSLATGRAPLAARLALVHETTDEARQLLTSFAAGQPGPELQLADTSSPPSRVGFLYTGQGSQYPAMAESLLGVEPVFTEAFDEVVAAFDTRLTDWLPPGASLRDIIAGRPDEAQIGRTVFTQAALFAVEYALTRLWISWGVTPAAVIGHSVGEIAAAVTAGVIDMESAVGLVSARGALMQSLPSGGAMTAVEAPLAEVEAAIAAVGGVVTVAGINSPSGTVISGRQEAVEAAAKILSDAGRRTTALDVSHAFHSPLMDPMLPDFAQALEPIDFAPPTLRLVSNVTGAVADAGIASADYWVQHVSAPVRFADGMTTMAGLGIDTFIEIGPHPVLTALGKACLAGEEVGSTTWVHSLRRSRDAHREILHNLGTFHVAGGEVDWAAVHQGFRRVDAPTTPFDRRSCWLPAVPNRPSVAARPGDHPVLGRPTEVPALGAKVYESVLSPDNPEWLDHHRLAGTVVFPGSAYIDLALAAGDGAPVASLNIQSPLVLRDGEHPLVQTTVTANGDGSRVQVMSSGADGWTKHAEARLATSLSETVGNLDLGRVPERFPESIAVNDYYQRLADVGLDYGPAFTGLTELRRGPLSAIGRVELPSSAGSIDGYVVHPALLDACFHVLGIAADDDSEDDTMFVPTTIESVVVHKRAERVSWCEVNLEEPAGPDTLSARVELYDDDGAALVTIGRLVVTATPRSLWSRLGQSAEDHLHELVWRGQEKGRGAGTESVEGPWLIVGQDEAASHLLDALGDPVSLSVGTDLDRVEAALEDYAGRSVEVVYLVSPSVDGTEPAWETVALAQIVSRNTAVDARLTLVTTGAVSVDGEVPDQRQAAVWGSATVLATELGQRWRGIVDLDPTGDEDLVSLADELCDDTRDPQIALRGGRRHVARLIRASRQPIEDGPLRLDVVERGGLDGMRREPFTPAQPGPGEVAVSVRASAINFRDVLNVLGMYPGDVGPPGLECAGIVTDVGDGVTTLSVGDRVAGIAPCALDSDVVTRADLLFRIPPRLSLAEAASVPIAFLTATFGLRTVAQLQAGERVLIHAATGGVGTAAVQLALATGATVFATAGSDEKRARLRALGIDHVYDSRSLDFADQILADTGGQGVHVALNSLSGEFITETMRVMAENGRFLEIGKRDILDEEQALGARPDVRYRAFDLTDLVDGDDHTELRRELLDIVEQLDSGELEPLPIRAFPIERVSDAFRFVAQARHIGKVVLTHHSPKPLVQPDGAYLVTGGLGGLGLAVARWLVHSGAGRIVLVGRSLPGPEASATIDELRAGGARVDVQQVDVADRPAVDALVAGLGEGDLPLRGVLHLAGTTEDAALSNQTRKHFTNVAAAKVQGAVALSDATTSIDLDWFVLFSSASALLGAAGQANYAAANRALDAVALRRRAVGLPATTINWGAWTEVGMASRLPATERRRLADYGVRGLSTASATEALTVALERPQAQFAIVGIDWPRFVAQASPALGPFLSELADPSATSTPAHEATVDLFAMLDDADVADRRAVLASVVDDNLAAVLGLGPDEPIDPDLGLTEIGMDSLMAVELSNRLASLLGQNIEATVVFEHPTARLLTERVVELIGSRVDFGADSAGSVGSAADGEDPETKDLDTDQLTSALLSELDDVGY